MTSTVQDDPYLALGLTKDATAAAIKTAYRKLVLKHHPDKVQDEAQKQTAADLFHKVQSAWEKIGDEEKRSRYDAKAHLDSLRKEAERDRQFTGARFSDMRQPPYHAAETRSHQTPRDMDRAGGYRTEEIRPQGAGDYFGEHRSSERRDYDSQPERSRRTPPRDDRRSKMTRQDSKQSDKEAERQRQREKVRLSTKATARDRDYKYSSYNSRPEVESGSDSDQYASQRRRSSKEDDHRTHERTFERRRSEDTGRYDERLQRQTDGVKEYIDRMSRRQQSDPLRRTSPSRVSSRDNTEYIKDSSGRPVQFRRGSGRPKTSRDDVDTSRRARREAERSGGESDDHIRRPPGLSQAKSAPNDIYLPYDKPRANSAQLSSEQMRDFIAGPMKRADSMPMQGSRRDETHKPPRSSHLRQTQFSDDYDVRKPSSTYPSPSSRSPKKEYADDFEKATPDGYVIETREPSRRMTRSPEPIREKTRTSSRQVPPPINTRYVYTDQGVEPLSSSRPKLSREGSSRKDSYLFGEVPSSASPRERQAYSGPESAKYHEVRPDYKMHSAYSSRRGENRSPSYYRGSSFSTVNPMSA
ncbi:hypothetical protein AMS68_001630 [Peltaster fructicola]|uniref:J domain-containing protein n=1 Tax=Peltaster fructicola TaxID=286661 RepID=A0A6H0XN15_9PEZI|nr:hypothetical protein AMS68_001630 [Peltaster fructicola]